MIFAASPSDQRYSIATLWFSIEPSSRRCETKAAVHGLKAEASAPRNPIVGSFPRLLRVRRERPHRCRAADERDELAAFYVEHGDLLPRFMPTPDTRRPWR
jgi:hypothetical protein